MRNRLPYLLVMLLVLTGCNNPKNPSSSEPGYVPPGQSSEVNYFENFDYSQKTLISDYIGSKYSGSKTYLSESEFESFVDICDSNDHVINNTNLASSASTYIYNPETDLPAEGYSVISSVADHKRDNDTHIVRGSEVLTSSIYSKAEDKVVETVINYTTSTTYDLDMMAYYHTILDSNNEIVEQVKKSFTPDEYYNAIMLVNSKTQIEAIDGFYDIMHTKKWSEYNKQIYLSSSTSLTYEISGTNFTVNPTNTSQTFVETFAAAYTYQDGRPYSFQITQAVTSDDGVNVDLITETTISNAYLIG